MHAIYFVACTVHSAAPVVHWSTIRLMMILSLILGLATAQADITAAFLHAPLDPGENIDKSNAWYIVLLYLAMY